MSPKTDWTVVVHPALPVMWVKTYIIEWDAFIAVPVLRESPAAKAAIERGIVTEVSRSEAQTINERFADESDGQAEFLHFRIDSRWSQMKATHKV